VSALVMDAGVRFGPDLPLVIRKLDSVELLEQKLQLLRARMMTQPLMLVAKPHREPQREVQVA